MFFVLEQDSIINKEQLQELDIVYIPEYKAIAMITTADRDSYAIEYLSEVCKTIVENKFGAKCAWFERKELIHINSIPTLLQQAVRCHV